MRTTELLSFCRFTPGTPLAITVAEVLRVLRVWVYESVDVELILMPIVGAAAGAVVSVRGSVLHSYQFLPHGIRVV